MKAEGHTPRREGNRSHQQHWSYPPSHLHRRSTSSVPRWVAGGYVTWKHRRVAIRGKKKPPSMKSCNTTPGEMTASPYTRLGKDGRTAAGKDGGNGDRPWRRSQATRRRRSGVANGNNKRVKRRQTALNPIRQIRNKDFFFFQNNSFNFINL